MAGILFEDIFDVKDIDPDGKKFDRGQAQYFQLLHTHLFHVYVIVNWTEVNRNDQRCELVQFTALTPCVFIVTRLILLLSVSSSLWERVV